MLERVLEEGLADATPRERMEIQVLTARALLDSGDPDGAAKLLSTALNTGPADIRAEVVAEAEKLLVDALGGSLGGAEPLIVLQLAELRDGRGDVAGAGDLLWQFVDANPHERVPATVTIELARLLAKRGDADEAERVLRRAADREGAPAEVLIELGDAYSRRERPAGADTVYRRALELEPDNVRALEGLAGVLERQGDLDEAIVLRGRAAELIAAGPAVPPEPDPHVAPEDPFDLLASAAGDLPATKDLLGFEPLVRALYALLDDPKTALPLAIAVTAPWGAGKSSVMRQLGDLLDGPAARSATSAPRRRWRTVRFDAWKYERSERLWAALVKAIYDQSQQGMSLREKLAFRARLERRRLGLWRLTGLTLVPLLVVVTAVTAALSADLSKEGTTVAGLSAAAVILATASRYGAMILNPFRRAIERYAKRPDFEAQLGFTAQADSEIRKLVSLLAPGPNDALAVFVDDLDRCSSAHVVEVVEAMNQIFNAAEDHHCVFILGLDRDIVATNISVAYGATVAQLKQDGNPLGEHFGSEFLAKLVQLSVAIPQPDRAGIHRLMEAIVGNAPPEEVVTEEQVEQAQQEIRERTADDGVESVEQAAAEVASSIPEPVVEVAKRRERAQRIKDSPAVVAAEFAALDFLEPNPRQVKRFHNAFRLQLYVASEDDRVTFDFSPDQLVALARWVALRLRWPGLADAIAREPKLLALLEAVANDGSSPPDADDSLRTRHKLWLEHTGALSLIRDERSTRRLSALRLDAFVRVA